MRAESVTATAVTFRVAAPAEERAAVMGIRDAVYVRERGYIDSVTDLAETFDVYDDHAVYIVADDDRHGVLGTVKVTADSAAGLPADALADLAGVRRAGRVVELGHLMTMPAARGRGIGRQLMRMAVIYGTRRYQATHVAGMFVLSQQSMREFYTAIGFAPVGEPVRDDRINGSPWCQVAAVSLPAAAEMARSPAGRANQRLRYFLHDYDFSAYDAWANGGAPGTPQASAAGREISG